ncbi:MAG: MvdC family ATP-grasp ribosomal peptide maturase [Leptolyngbyaceae cyanobacterium]
MSLSKPVVLLLTHSDDFFTIDRVAEALSQRGAHPFRLNTDLFPSEIQLSAAFTEQGLSHRIQYAHQSIAVDDIHSVWLRKIRQPKLSPDLDERFRDGCIRESYAALEGFFDSLVGVPWLDPLEHISAAENKLRQLRIAREVGLCIPQTLVTNHPQEAQEFFQALQGNVVAKMLTPLSQGMAGSTFFVYTSPVSEADLLEADSLRHSPMVFQATIPKQRELRVVYVDGQCFVGALEAVHYAKETMDWRRAQSPSMAWLEDELPTEVSDAVRALMTRLGLAFGAIDMIRTPAGKHVFLEVNPCGEWGMLERDLDFSISGAIADVLLSKAGVSV